jgi:hypothetical protein
MRHHNPGLHTYRGTRRDSRTSRRLSRSFRANLRPPWVNSRIERECGREHRGNLQTRVEGTISAGNERFWAVFKHLNAPRATLICFV